VHPLYVENDTIKMCKQNNIIIEAYSPFAKFNPKVTQNPKILKIA
jgi:diketogulonate reductase-like aldo/keto reductase